MMEELQGPQETFQHWLDSNEIIRAIYVNLDQSAQSLVGIAFSSGAIQGMNESIEIARAQLTPSVKTCTGFAERWLLELMKRVNERKYATIRTDEGLFIVRPLNWEDEQEREIGAVALRNEEMLVPWDK